LVSKSGLAGFWRLGWIEKIFIGVVVYYVMNRSINFHDLWGPFDQGLIFSEDNVLNQNQPKLVPNAATK